MGMHWLGQQYLVIFALLPLVLSHLHPHARTKRSDEKGIEEEKAHLSEELEERFGDLDVENMTEEERDFHYFRLHDFDQNDLLDGLEVFKALVHEHEHNKNDSESEPEKYGDKSFDDIVEVIDQVLEEDDLNKDGFLSYSEFVAGRRRSLKEDNSNSEF